FGDFDGPEGGPAATAPPKPRLSSPTDVATGELSSDLFAAFAAPRHATASPPGGHDRTTGGGGSQAGVGSPAAGEGGVAEGLGRTSPRSSSYGYFEGEEPSWEEYDRHVARRLGDLDSDPSAKGGGGQDTPLEATPSSGGAHPQQWDFWAEDLAYIRGGDQAASPRAATPLGKPRRACPNRAQHGLRSRVSGGRGDRDRLARRRC
ncbi:unnamed protein product, partial [Ectocarpus sp. 8 AP-2014]